MSPLTKAFVVLTTLLSVIMVSMTVAHVARTEDYRAKYVDLVNDHEAALKRVATQSSDRATQAASAEGTNAEYETALSQVRAELESKLGEIRQRDQTISNLQTNSSRLTAANEAISATLTSTNERLAAQDEQIRSLITDLAGITRQKTEVEQSLAIAIGDRTRYENEVRRLTERLLAEETERAELEVQRDELLAAFEVMQVNPEDILRVAEVRITGSVTNVDQVGEGLTLVEVNVGQRDGVRRDMPFTIYRGSQYVGTIHITNVDTDRSVGEVQLATDTIRSGDGARTKD